MNTSMYNEVMDLLDLLDLLAELDAVAAVAAVEMYLDPENIQEVA